MSSYSNILRTISELGLCYYFSLMQLTIIFFIFGEQVSRFTLSYIFLYSICSLARSMVVFDLKIVPPLRIVSKVMPAEQISHFLVYFPVITFGARYRGVPTLGVFVISLASSTLLKPKSQSLTEYQASIKMFSGFKSRCIRSFSCRAFTPWAI